MSGIRSFVNIASSLTLTTFPLDEYTHACTCHHWQTAELRLVLSRFIWLQINTKT